MSELNQKKKVRSHTSILADKNSRNPVQLKKYVGCLADSSTHQQLPLLQTDVSNFKS